jgi:hypothetical protein
VIRPFVQGDLATRVKALRFPAVLALARITAAGLVVALLYQIGSVTAAHLPRRAALVVCVVAALAALVADVRAIRHRSYSVGLSRQTAKALAHQPDRPWWITPLFWGLDTGLIWSTFRVSAASWVLLLSALLNVAPQRSGLVYGAFFAIPLLVAVCLDEPDTFRRPDGWPLRLAQATAVALLAVLPLATALAACDRPPPRPEHGSPCDDSVSPSDRVPEAMRGHGIDSGVGSGEVWFVDPGLPRWRDRLEPRGDGFWGKYPLWVGGSQLPQVTVRGIEGTAGDGTAELNPAGEAPPGPVPMGVTIPTPGLARHGHRGFRLREHRGERHPVISPRKSGWSSMSASPSVDRHQGRCCRCRHVRGRQRCHRGTIPRAGDRVSRPSWLPHQIQRAPNLVAHAIDARGTRPTRRSADPSPLRSRAGRG